VRARATLLLAAGLLAAAACSDDDDAQGGSTTVGTDPPPTTGTTAVAATSAPATTATPATSDPPTTSAPPTTSTPPTTEPPLDEEALKAQIAADYERTFYRRATMLRHPRVRNVEARVATVLVEGSPAFDAFVARIRDLVALGDAVVPNDPDLYSATIESVELVGRPPYRRAIVTVCEVDNRKQVTLPENSPSGEEILVAGSGELQVIRYEEPVRRTQNGWLRFKSPREGIGYDGEMTCPPA
jgi:hypothetical protein